MYIINELAPVHYVLAQKACANIKLVYYFNKPMAPRTQTRAKHGPQLELEPRYPLVLVEPVPAVQPTDEVGRIRYREKQSGQKSRLFTPITVKYTSQEIEITDQNRHFFPTSADSDGNREMTSDHSASVVSKLKDILASQAADKPRKSTRERAFYDDKGEFYDKITIAGLEDITATLEYPVSEPYRRHEVYLETDNDDGQRQWVPFPLGEIITLELSYDASKELDENNQLKNAA